MLQPSIMTRIRSCRDADPTRRTQRSGLVLAAARVLGARRRDGTARLQPRRERSARRPWTGAPRSAFDQFRYIPGKATWGQTSLDRRRARGLADGDRRYHRCGEVEMRSPRPMVAAVTDRRQSRADRRTHRGSWPSTRAATYMPGQHRRADGRRDHVLTGGRQYRGRVRQPFEFLDRSQSRIADDRGLRAAAPVVR